MKQEIKILAIETSCDETAAAVIGVENNQPVILSNIVSSQIDLHAKTGGVVPEVASRAHMESMIPVVQEALSQEISNSKFLISNKNPNDQKANKLKSYELTPDSLSQITHIAVTAGPGLIGSLLVGFNTAKAMAYALDLPIVPINHIEGHIYSALAEQNPNDKIQITNKSQISNLKSEKTKNLTSYKLQPNSFPILALTVSGGHTSLTLMKDHGVYETIGQTRDDAAGEAFDKVAKLLGLGYPGGPAVSKLADNFRKSRELGVERMERGTQNSPLPTPDSSPLVLPRPMINDKSFDFSFSGLKTAVLDVIREIEHQNSHCEEPPAGGDEAISKNRLPRLRLGERLAMTDKKKLSQEQKAEICAAFEDAAVDVLVKKTLRAAEKYQPKAVILAGGVAANKQLRKELALRLSQNPNIKIQITNKFQIPKSKNPSEANEANNLIKLIMPPAELCGDNAAMIGLAAYYHIARGDTKKWNQIKIDSNLKL